MIIICLGLPNSGIQLAFNAVSLLVEEAGYDQLRVRRDFISKKLQGTKGGHLNLTPATFGALIDGLGEYGIIVIKINILSLEVISSLSMAENVKIISVKSSKHFDKVHGARFGGFEKNDATYGLQRLQNITLGQNEDKNLEALKILDVLNLCVRDLISNDAMVVDKLTEFLGLTTEPTIAVKERVLSLTTSEAIFTGTVRTTGIIDSIANKSVYTYLSITTSNKPHFFSNHVSVSGISCEFVSFSAMGLRGVLEVKILRSSVNEEFFNIMVNSDCVNIEFGTHVLDELGGNYLLARPMTFGSLDFFELGNKTIRCHFLFPDIHSMRLSSGDGVGLNGVAMTIESVSGNSLTFCMIESTRKLTALSYLVPGSKALLEADALGLRRIYPKHDRERVINTFPHLSADEPLAL